MCDNFFVPTTEQRYCSEACLGASDGLALIERGRGPRAARDDPVGSCAVCSATLFNHRALYCSTACKNASRAEARRWVSRLDKYGITKAQFDSLFSAQGSCCAVCKIADPGGKGWHLDHDHRTDKVRGILCSRCNVGLGMFRDNPALLEAAIGYLEKPPAQAVFSETP